MLIVSLLLFLSSNCHPRTIAVADIVLPDDRISSKQKSFPRLAPTYRHDVFVVGGKSHAVDAILMTGELRHAAPVLDVPDSDGGKMSTFSSDQVPTIL